MPYSQISFAYDFLFKQANLKYASFAYYMSIKLIINDDSKNTTSYQKMIFYYCHIDMSKKWINTKFTNQCLLSVQELIVLPNSTFW
jgi:hypothetical protein